MLKIPFSKYSGCGNDFILIDNRAKLFPDERSLIQNLCRRSLGIGADGLILLEMSQGGHFLMRVFNPDGKEAEMCGNGLRCFAMFLKELKIPGDHFLIEVTNKLYPVSVEGKRVSVSMVPPNTIEWDLPVQLDDQNYLVDYLDTGVPHAVHFVRDIEKIDVAKMGSLLRNHTLFAPKGTNVDFAILKENETIELRTYERGVEGETLACGTGAAATAIVASLRHKLKNPVVVRTKSGDCLEFELSITSDRIDKIMMKGPAKQIYSGIVEV